MEFVDHCEITQVHQGAVDQVRQVLPPDEVLSDLADLFKIFGDSTRIKILYALLRSELCVCDIADLLGLTQSAISHQLRVLRSSKLVKFRRDGKTLYYSLADEHVCTSSARGWNTWKSERWLSFIADHVCLCPGRRGDRRAVAEETAVPACCAFLEGAVPPSNRVPSRPAVSRWTRW